MLDTRILQMPISLAIEETSTNHLELSRLLAAAVVNPQFCQSLLQDPELAIQNGFQGETFLLNEKEQALILSIRADSLADLATQLARTYDDRPLSSMNHTAHTPALIMV